MPILHTASNYLNQSLIILEVHKSNLQLVHMPHKFCLQIWIEGNDRIAHTTKQSYFETAAIIAGPHDTAWSMLA